MSKTTSNSKTFKWLVEHTPQFQEKYSGKWIAVVRQEIAGIGNTALDAYQQAKEKYPKSTPLLDFVPTEECLIL
jgi:hypothetical protein